MHIIAREIMISGEWLLRNSQCLVSGRILLGAGAIVATNLQIYATFVGNPARKVGVRTVEGRETSVERRGLEYELNYRPWLL
jgi:hypothetical protein